MSRPQRKRKEVCYAEVTSLEVTESPPKKTREKVIKTGDQLQPTTHRDIEKDENLLSASNPPVSARITPNSPTTSPTTLTSMDSGPSRKRLSLQEKREQAEIRQVIELSKRTAVPVLSEKDVNTSLQKGSSDVAEERVPSILVEPFKKESDTTIVHHEAPLASSHEPSTSCTPLVQKKENSTIKSGKERSKQDEHKSAHAINFNNSRNPKSSAVHTAYKPVNPQVDNPMNKSVPSAASCINSVPLRLGLSRTARLKPLHKNFRGV
ncbi:hypothetical protein DFS34DRAFT_654049 [Phlyctochytrium arcticum]|nr:hypothetical protein DFS34DRAFT_654049 [Phlyctochytrium arcticum]